MTLGQLLGRARQRLAIGDAEESVLSETLRERNMLTHHFFAQYETAFGSAVGRQGMIERLRALITLYKQADAIVWSWYAPLLQRAGITEQDVERMKAEQAAPFLGSNESSRGE